MSLGSKIEACEPAADGEGSRCIRFEADVAVDAVPGLGEVGRLSPADQPREKEEKHMGLGRGR